MATVIHTKKGFKVIKMTVREATEICHFGINNILICDTCNNILNFNEVYYVPVLNSILCEDCYNRWYENAKYYEEDAHYEAKRFGYYCELFKAIDNLDVEHCPSTGD